jgi:hypothetical protein
MVTHSFSERSACADASPAGSERPARSSCREARPTLLPSLLEEGDVPQGCIAAAEGRVAEQSPPRRAAVRPAPAVELDGEAVRPDDLFKACAPMSHSPRRGARGSHRGRYPLGRSIPPARFPDWLSVGVIVTRRGTRSSQGTAGGWDSIHPRCPSSCDIAHTSDADNRLVGEASIAMQTKRCKATRLAHDNSTLQMDTTNTRVRSAERLHV